MNDQNKVTADHLRRDAYLYVRQSSLYQVANNTESSRRQYDLRGRAVALDDERAVGNGSFFHGHISLQNWLSLRLSIHPAAVDCQVKT